MAEKIKSNLTGKEYYLSNIVRILNLNQVFFYTDQGIFPIDMYPSKDFNTNKSVLVFLYEKEKTKDLYQKWLESKPNKEDA